MHAAFLKNGRLEDCEGGVSTLLTWRRLRGRNWLKFVSSGGCTATGSDFRFHQLGACPNTEDPCRNTRLAPVLFLGNSLLASLRVLSVLRGLEICFRTIMEGHASCFGKHCLDLREVG